MNFLERIVHWDQSLFFKINTVWTNPVFDLVFPFIRESIIWIPLYLFLFVFIWINFGIKGLYWSVALICTASLCDIVSSHLIKEAFLRFRPCRDPVIGGDVRFLVKYCPMSSSFISSHATTHFGVAMFIHATLKKFTASWTGLFFAWAGFISYAQVYVGVHFPGDVLAGTLVGLGIGVLISKIFNKYVGLNGQSFTTMQERAF